MAGPIALPLSAQIEIAGAEHAAAQIKKVGDEIDKATDATDENTLAGIKNAQQQTNTFLAYQALTSGLNQLSGGLNKVSGSMIAMGGSAEEYGMILQKATRQFELLTGSLEIYIAYKNTVVGVTELYTASTFKATVATHGFNAALWANPIMMIAGFVILLVTTLFLLGARFQHVTDTVKGLSIAFRELMEWLDAIQDKIGGVGDAVGDFASGITDKLSIGGQLGGGAAG